MKNKKTVFNAKERHKLLRDFRSGISQRKLANRHGVDQSTISRQLDIAIQERTTPSGYIAPNANCNEKAWDFPEKGRNE